MREEIAEEIRKLNITETVNLENYRIGDDFELHVQAKFPDRRSVTYRAQKISATKVLIKSRSEFTLYLTGSGGTGNVRPLKVIVDFSENQHPMREILKFYENKLVEQLKRISIGDPIVTELAMKQLKKIRRRISLIHKISGTEERDPI